MSRDQLGFSTAPKMSRIMEVNGHYAAIMRADKKKEDNGGLPSGVPIPCLPVDYLKNRPDFWVQGSYVCPVDSDWGLWFNWQMNRRDISILTSVKGMNPITGQRISGLGLEQYKEQCPVHKIPLKHGKFCPECNFKWPDQNYITDPTSFYLDGFRSEDGIVRQFYFTEDMAKSVPELVIGKEDTVPAFGFCFYTLKNNPRKFEGGNRLRNQIPDDWKEKYRMPAGFYDSVRMTSSSYRGSGASSGSYTSYRGSGTEIKWMGLGVPAGVSDVNTAYACSSGIPTSSFLKIGNATSFNTVLEEKTVGSFEFLDNEKPSRIGVEVGIGAGAKIDQKFDRDVHSIDEWQDKPAGVIRVYFVFQEEFERYVEAGLNDLSGYKEGYLNGVPVGVDHE